MRPVVSTTGSKMEVASRWLDEQLKPLLKFYFAYLKDSSTSINKLNKLSPLPTNTKLSTSDATSMYTNIETTEGINVIRKWLILHLHHLPKDFDIDLIIKILKVIMENCIF